MRISGKIASDYGKSHTAPEPFPATELLLLMASRKQEMVEILQERRRGEWWNERGNGMNGGEDMTVNYGKFKRRR